MFITNKFLKNVWLHIVIVFEQKLVKTDFIMCIVNKCNKFVHNEVLSELVAQSFTNSSL